MTNADRNPCPARSEDGYACTLLRGHTGAHEARTDWSAAPIATWSADEPPHGIRVAVPTRAGAGMKYTDAIGAAIAAGNAHMTARGGENWSIADDRRYREELARLTGEPLASRPWDDDELRCTCADCAAGKIPPSGCSLPAHEFTEVDGTRCWNCGAAKVSA